MRASRTLDSPKGARHRSEGRQERGGSAPRRHGRRGRSTSTRGRGRVADPGRLVARRRAGSTLDAGAAAGTLRPCLPSRVSAGRGPGPASAAGACAPSAADSPSRSLPASFLRENGVTAMRIFSGIQPTGAKHLGNYSGGFRQYVATQEQGDAFFCIVDLHSITIEYDPEVLREATLSLAALLFAAGLDPERSTVFCQSHVSAHAEAAWLLSAVTSHGPLGRMTQFKEK